jgi:hypothetical protein
MPKVRRQNLPQRLMDHLLDRVSLRQVSADDLIALRDWLDSNPEVPAGNWFKTFDNFFICGKGELVKTVLSKEQSPIGEQLF